jgi:hypothetical protein
MKGAPMRNFFVSVGIVLGMIFLLLCVQVSGSLTSKISLWALAIFLILNASKILQPSTSEYSTEDPEADIGSDSNSCVKSAEEPEE